MEIGLPPHCRLYRPTLYLPEGSHARSRVVRMIRYQHLKKSEVAIHSVLVSGNRTIIVPVSRKYGDPTKMGTPRPVPIFSVKMGKKMTL